MRDDLLRNHILLGIRDTKLSECLHMDENLMLKTALYKERSKEMISKQSQILQDLSITTADDFKQKEVDISF